MVPPVATALPDVPDVPKNAEELWRDYRGLCRSIVTGMGVPAQEADDVTSIIMHRIVEADIISMYRPESGNTFKTFFKGNVKLRVKGQRDKLGRYADHNVLKCDQADESGTTWLDLHGGQWWDDYSALDAEEFICRMRTWLALQPPRSDNDRCDLLALFDVLVEQGRTDDALYPAVQKRFGVGYTTARVWVTRLREVLAEGRDQVIVVPTWEIGGLTLDAPAIRECISVLRSRGNTQVRQPLQAEKHPLGDKALGDWYRPFAEEELAAYPELEHPAGTKAKHWGRIKTGVLHRMERMLAEAATPRPAEDEAGSFVPLVVAVPVIPDSREDALEELEGLLWKLHADAATVQLGLALAQVPA